MLMICMFIYIIKIPYSFRTDIELNAIIVYYKKINRNLHAFMQN